MVILLFVAMSYIFCEHFNVFPQGGSAAVVSIFVVIKTWLQMFWNTCSRFMFPLNMNSWAGDLCARDLTNPRTKVCVTEKKLERAYLPEDKPLSDLFLEIVHVYLLSNRMQDA